MLNAGGAFVLAYMAIAIAVVFMFEKWEKKQRTPKADTVVVALGWPVLVVVVGLMLLLGVVLPAWGEIGQ